MIWNDFVGFSRMSWKFTEAEHSQLYLKYRPKYPGNVYKLIADKLKESYELLPETQKGTDTISLICNLRSDILLSNILFSMLLTVKFQYEYLIDIFSG